MTYKVLLLGNDRTYGLKLARLIIDLGHKPLADDWKNFTPRAYPRISRPKLIIANCDHPDAVPFTKFAAHVRKCWGHSFPIIALSMSRKFGDVAALVDAGADCCLPPDAPDALMTRRITVGLTDSPISAATELTEEIPGSLLGLFLGNESLVRLGSFASVHSGAAPRSSWSRRTAPPDESWRKIITADALHRFHIGQPSTYLLWSKLHLFRVPDMEEYSVPEKVVLSRVGPPITAAVDRSRLAIGADVYSIVPGEAIGAGFIACLLNSRLFDFYFNRLAPIQDSRLRPDNLRNMPIPQPTRALNREFNRYATLLGHFGPQPENWIDQQSREEVLDSMNAAVFRIYGVASTTREELAELHF